MIQIDWEGLTLNVPVKDRMHIDEFLELADRLQKLMDTHNDYVHGEHEEHVHETHHAPPEWNEPEPTQHDFKFEHEEEERFQRASHQLLQQTDRVKALEAKLDTHDEHIKQMLKYLQALDKHLRK